MTRTLVLSTLVEIDLAAAREWYNHMRPGLGEDLLLCVEHALDRILEHPEAFPSVMPDVRRTLVRRFPFGVFYRVRRNRIEVEALFPLRADPTHLRDRLDPPDDLVS